MAPSAHEQPPNNPKPKRIYDYSLAYYTGITVLTPTICFSSPDNLSVGRSDLEARIDLCILCLFGNFLDELFNFCYTPIPCIPFVLIDRITGNIECYPSDICDCCSSCIMRNIVNPQAWSSLIEFATTYALNSLSISYICCHISQLTHHTRTQIYRSLSQPSQDNSTGDVLESLRNQVFSGQIDNDHHF